jgi:hypothetical protein
VATAACLVSDDTGIRVDPKLAARLARSITALVGEGLMPLRLQNLCGAAQPPIGPGRVRDHLSLGLCDALALASRTTFMNDKVPAPYEVIFVQPADAGVAVSPGAHGGKVRHVGLALASVHSFVPVRIRALIAGTPGQSGLLADRELLERFSLEMGRPVATDVGAEILELVLMEERVRALAEQAQGDLAALGAKRRRDVLAALPDLLVIPGLFTGPTLPDRDVGTGYLPGTDLTLLAGLEALGRPVLLYEGERTAEEVRALHLMPGLRPPGVLPMAGHIGVATLPYGVTYRADGKRLLRLSHSENSRTGAPGLQAETWATLNMPHESRLKAIAVIESRKLQQWQDGCLLQFRRRTQPGLLQGGHARYRAAQHMLLVLANAALVHADRIRRMTLNH